MPSVRMTHVTALLLQALERGHAYGFDIMDVTGLASGTVYPALRRLEKARWVRGRWEDVAEAHRVGRPQRRVYEITPVGREALPDAARKLADARALLDPHPRTT